MTTRHDPERRERLLDAALAASRGGWRVFPLRPGGKRPALHADWEHRATTDRQRIHRCWRHGPPYNVGIATGPSGLVVVDLDTPKHGDQPPPEWARPGIVDGADVLADLADAHGQPLPFDTYGVRTASGGMHLYFTTPDGTTLRNTAGRLGWLVDTRAAGGYVVAAGSIVDGRQYEIVNDIDPAPLPAWLAALLADPTPEPRNLRGLLSTLSAHNPSQYAGAALRGEVQRVLDATEGTRNDTLNRAAFALGQLVAAGVLPEQLAYDCLHAAALHTELPAREAAATIRSGLRSGARKPRMEVAA